MRRLLPWAALALTACAPTLEARLDDVGHWKAPAATDYPDDDAVILEFDHRVLLSVHPSRKTFTQHRIHSAIAVLRENGYNAGEVPLLLPDGFRLVEFVGRTINPGGEIHEVDREDVLETTIEVPPQEGDPKAEATTEKVHVVHFPAVQVGSILEYAYTIEFDGVYATSMHTPQGGWPVKHYRLEITGTPPVRYAMKLFNTDERIRVDDGGAGWRLVWETRDLPAVPRESWRPHWSTYQPWAAFRVKQIVRGNSVSDFARRWKDIFDSLANQLYIENEATLAGFDAKIDRDGCDGARCLVERALAFVRDETEFTGFGSIGSILPMKDVLRLDRADNVERAFLLWKLLTDAEVEARFALASRFRSWQPGLDFPLSAVFDHLLVYVPAQGDLNEPLWLDPSCDHCDPGELPGWSRDMPAQIVRAEPRFDQPPEVEVEAAIARGKRPTDELDEEVFTVTLAANGELSGTLRERFTGDGAVWYRRNTRTRLPREWKQDAEWLAAVRWPTGRLEKHGPAECDVRAARCERVVGFRIPGHATLDGDRLLVPLSFLSRHRARWFDREERQLDIDIDNDDTYVDTVELTLPEGWVVDHLPAPEQRTSAALAYAFSARNHGKKVVVRRELRLRPGTYPRDTYDTLRAPARAFAAARQKVIVLRRASAVAATAR